MERKNDMSAMDELVRKYQSKSQKQLARFFLELGTLQAECKHPKTHWMQELTRDGSFKEGLYKRCFVCGSTVERVDVNASNREQLLLVFDEAVEKLSVQSKRKGVEDASK